MWTFTFLRLLYHSTPTHHRVICCIWKIVWTPPTVRKVCTLTITYSLLSKEKVVAKSSVAWRWLCPAFSWGQCVWHGGGRADPCGEGRDRRRRAGKAESEGSLAGGNEVEASWANRLPRWRLPTPQIWVRRRRRRAARGPRPTPTGCDFLSIQSPDAVNCTGGRGTALATARTQPRDPRQAEPEAEQKAGDRRP